MSVWFFQANPKLYDIDAALQKLEAIWWRVPQYTSDVHRGDVVVLWRSGSEAGIVGVGRVAAEPREHESDESEATFVLDPEIAGPETRALIRVKPTRFVPKSDVAALDGFAEHPIIMAPRGTVISIDDALYQRLEPLIVDPPELSPIEAVSLLPPPFAWDQRSKSTHPMPGGYDGYLDSLAQLAVRIIEERPIHQDFPELIADEFEVSANRSKLLAAFLHKAGFVVDREEVVALSDPTSRWMESRDPRIPIGLLHSRIRFIGEMLEAAVEPKTTGAMLDVANQEYGCGWSTKAQIDRRRGWLQSAAMLEVDETNRLVTTATGRQFLSELDLYRPPEAPAGAAAVSKEIETVDEVVPEEPPVPSLEANPLLVELTESSVDSSNADRFERAVRDAFEWLGFKAEWLGGAGKTDVLLDAPLGLERSYRVIVDCKTSASGNVGDAQVDWITLSEHKKKHDADYVALVAPSPSGSRLFQRAAEQLVTVIAVDELVTLCEQHENAPLDLESYRTLFETGGVVSTDATAEKAEDWLHVVELAQLIVDTIAVRSEKFGSLNAAGLQLLLADDQLADSASVEDFQSILDTLSGPLLAVLAGDPTSGYRLTTTRSVARHRLELLARTLFG